MLFLLANSSGRIELDSPTSLFWHGFSPYELFRAGNFYRCDGASRHGRACTCREPPAGNKPRLLQLSALKFSKDLRQRAGILLAGASLSRWSVHSRDVSLRLFCRGCLRSQWASKHTRRLHGRYGSHFCLRRGRWRRCGWQRKLAVLPKRDWMSK
jgi:hypothetical protein